MSTVRKVLSNTAAQFIAKIFIAVLGLSVTKITTKYLGLSGYGEYASVYEFIGLFSIFANLGLFTLAVKEISEHEDRAEKIIGNILTIRSILLVITMSIAVISIFSIKKYSDTRIPLGVAIATMSMVMINLEGAISSVLQAKLQMHQTSISRVFGKAINVGLMIYVVFWGFPMDSDTGFYFLIVAGIVGNGIMLLTTSFFASKITKIRYRFDLDLWKDIFRKCLPYGLALILNSLYFRIDSILILFIRGKEEVGIYGVAMKILENLMVITVIFMNSVLPVLTKTIKEKSDQYRAVISHSFDFLAAIAIPMVVGVVLLAYPAIFIIATPEFLSDLSVGFIGSDIALQVLIFALVFQAFNILFSFILLAIDQQNKILIINAVCLAFNIITNLILIPIYGFLGAAVTSILCEILILFGVFYFAKKHLEFSLNYLNTLKIIFSAAVMGLFIYVFQPITYNFIQNWNVLLLVPIGGLIYIGMLMATKTVTMANLRLLRKGESEVRDYEESPPVA